MKEQNQTENNEKKVSLVPDMVTGVLIAIAIWLITDNLITGIAVGVTIGAGLNVIKEMKNRKS